MYQQFFISAIEQLKQENRYRKFVNISRLCGQFPYAINNDNQQKIIVWCSNDYLGMGQNQSSINLTKEALEKYGIGAGGTRNISGNNKPLVELENTVALLHNKEKAIICSSGYITNDTAVQTLSHIIPNLIIFSDAKNHASIIAGIRNSKAKKHIFSHNNLTELEKQLKLYSVQQPKLIIFESVYSMDGDFGDIYGIVELAKKYQALTYIDEVHAVGIYGNGSGLSKQLNLNQEIDFIQGTFGKAFGVFGGYLTGDQISIDAIRSYASGFIFSTAMPPAFAVGIRENILHLQQSKKEREVLFNNVSYLKQKLQQANIKIFNNQSHIVSVMVGNAYKAEQISSNLLNKHNIYVQHINYPTVEKNDERLRITATSLHNFAMIDELVFALQQAILFATPISTN
jgi:5-aminolevulinate synthase